MIKFKYFVKIVEGYVLNIGVCIVEFGEYSCYIVWVGVGRYIGRYDGGGGGGGC